MRRRAFCVGQAKSGTASLAGLLSTNYRAAHEPERAETLDLILREARGQLSAPDVRTYLRERDARLDLEYFPASSLDRAGGHLNRGTWSKRIESLVDPAYIDEMVHSICGANMALHFPELRSARDASRLWAGDSD